MLRLRTLGAVLVERDGLPLGGSAGQRRVLGLLTVLASARGTGISRDRVLAILWSESDPERAPQALTQSLYHTRRVLGEDELFVATANISLNPSVMEADVWEFESLVGTGDFERAAALYEGPFLDGFYVNGAPEFERWASEERSRLATLYGEVLERLATAAESALDFDSAVTWRKRQAALDPLNSRIALALMTAMAASGNPGGAIDHARVHGALLRGELDTAPDAAVTAFAERLRIEPANAGMAHPAMFELPGQPANEASIELLTDAETDSDPPAIMVDAGGPVATVSGVRPSPVSPLAPEVDLLVSRSSRGTVTADSAPALVSLKPKANAARRLLGLGAAVLLAATLLAVIVWARRPVAAVTVSAVPVESRPSIAVAPFRVAGADASLAYLREGMVDLLATKLTEDEATLVADPGAVMSAWRRGGLADRTDITGGDALAVAREVGAERLLIGSVVGTARHLVISGSVLAVARGDVRAQATVEGPADSLTVLVDRLAARLLAKEAGVWERLEGHTSASTSALRAFLDGQAAYRRGGYRAAVQLFQRALARDRGFALAGLGLALAAARIDATELETRGLAAAWAARSDLSEPDAAYLVALAGPRFPAASSDRERLGAWEQAASVAPNRPGVWHGLGEHLMQAGQLLGMRDWRARAIAALQHAVMLDSSYAPSVQHLVQLAALEGDSAQLRSTAQLYARIDTTGDVAPFLLWRTAIARGDSVELTAFRRRLTSLPTPSLRAIALTAQYDGLGIADAARALDALVSRAERATERTDYLVGLHALALNAARPTRALALTRELEDVRPLSSLSDRMRVLDALYAHGDSDAAAASASALSRADVALRDTSEAARADRCVLAQRRAWHDLAGGSGTTTLPPRISVPCGALVEAIIATRQRRPDAPARVARLDSLVTFGPPAGELGTYAHLPLARLYSALGNAPRALAAVRRRPYMREWPLFLASALTEEGRLAEAVGDTRGAITAYRHLLALRPSPEPFIEQELADVRARLAQLTVGR